MTSEEIIEGNKLIAQFMGGHITALGNISFQPGTLFMPKELKYNSSWDWLIPAIIKCKDVCKEKTRECVNNNNPSLDDVTGWKAWSYRDIDVKLNINFMWFDVIEFIKWYNDIQNTKCPTAAH